MPVGEREGILPLLREIPATVGVNNAVPVGKEKEMVAAGAAVLADGSLEIV